MADTPYPEVAGLPFNAPTKTLQYGEEALQRADYWSADHGATLILLIHGGCWLNQYNKDHIRPLASKLAESGFAVLSIEYRRVGDTGGGWPGTFNDIEAALAFAEQLPYQHIITAGHSAGGHLALWIAAHHPGTQLIGAIGLAAITDLETYSKGSSGCQRATPKLMGGTPTQVPERYISASPKHLIFETPTYLIHGTKDSIVSNTQSRNFCKNRQNCALQELDEQGHFNLIDPRQEVTELITQKAQEWLQSEP